MATIEEEAKRRALEMQGAPDTGFDFAAVARSLAGTPIPTTHGYGLSPENVSKEAQLGQQAQGMKQKQVGQNIEQALQRDSQLAQKIQMAHQNVMGERKLALDQTLAGLEAKRTNASIGLMGAQAGAISKQNKLSDLQYDKATMEFNTIKALDSTMIDVPMLGKDGNLTSVPMSAYAAKTAGFDVDGAVRTKIAADSREKIKLSPYMDNGFSALDAKTMGGPVQANFRLFAKQELKALEGKGGRRGGPADPKETEAAINRAYERALGGVKGLLSEEGRARARELGAGYFDELASKSEASSKAETDSENIAKMLIEGLRNSK